jgi:hypothetical protein
MNSGIDIPGWNWIRFWAMALLSALGVGPAYARCWLTE